MNLRLIFAASLLPAPLSLPLAPQARAATTETFLGCPAGFALQSVADPRALSAPTPLSTPRAEQQLVVQCVSLQVAAPPACPATMSRTAISGRDTCTPRPRSPAPTVSDGTSNTVMIGETPPAPPSSTAAKTTGTVFSSVPNPVFPSCTAPAALVPDPAGQLADTCVIRTVSLPADHVSVTR